MKNKNDWIGEIKLINLNETLKIFNLELFDSRFDFMGVKMKRRKIKWKT